MDWWKTLSRAFKWSAVTFMVTATILVLRLIVVGEISGTNILDILFLAPIELDFTVSNWWYLIAFPAWTFQWYVSVAYFAANNKEADLSIFTIAWLVGASISIVALAFSPLSTLATIPFALGICFALAAFIKYVLVPSARWAQK